jgi:hypothetical protein
MLAGVLVDVSGSMKSALQLDTRLEDQPVTRAQSIFSTIISIVQREGGFRESEEIFVLAFGLADVNTCDLLSLLDDVRRSDRQYGATSHESLTRLLTENGAPYTGQYIKKYLSQQAAGSLFETFSQDRTLLTNTIAKLPLVCKNATAHNTYSTGKTAYSTGKTAYSTGKTVYSIVRNYLWSSFQSNTPDANRLSSWSNTPDADGLSSWSDRPDVATPNINRDYEEKITEQYFKETMRSSAVTTLKTMLRPQKRSLDNVISLLQEVASSSSFSPSAQEPLSAAQLSRLVNAIKPYIYGNTPMCESLGYALQTFQSTNHTSKVLFLLSDGESTDGDPVTLAERLHHSDVIVFACLLTSKNIRQPRRLYDAPDLD